MKRPLHRSGEIKASIKEVNAKQERQNSGGGTILGQVWGRLSAKGINKAIASIDTIAIRDKIASV